MAENSDEKQRRRGPGRPFEPGRSGNPAGKPKGTRHQITLLAEQLLDGEAEGLVRKAVELALSGDVAALRLLLERILPPRRDRPVRFALPPISTPHEAVAAHAALVSAVAAGELTPSDASELSGLIANVVKAIEATELEQRVYELELAAKETKR
jgi:hypothetical protein